MIFIWLQGVNDQWVDGFIKTAEIPRGANIWWGHNRGQLYLKIDHDPFDPTVKIPHIPQEFVKEVTWRPNHCGQTLRPDGLYRYEGATLWAKTTFYPDGGYLRFQELSIHSSTLQGAKKIYELFVKAAINPVPDWTAEA